MEGVLGFLAFAAFIICLITVLYLPCRPRRSKPVPLTELPPPETITIRLYHSKYCATRYGSDCNCEGPQA